MRMRYKETRMREWVSIVAALLFVTALLVPTAQASEEIAARTVYHTVKAETKEVGDVPGHIAGAVHHAGLCFFTKGPASGEIATRTSTAQVDVVNGKGTFTTDIVYTLQDGSTLSQKATGTASPADDGKRTLYEGTYEMTGGTGKFAGIKGTGTFKGARLGSPQSGGDSYVDFTGAITK